MKFYSDEKKRSWSRRNVLKTGMLSVTAGAVSPVVKARAEGNAPKNMHVSLAAYSMRDAMKDGSMDLFSFIDWCAELDLAGTELTSYYFKEGFDKRYLHELKRRAFDNGVTVSGTAVGNNFCLPSGPAKQKEIDHVKQWIDYSVEFSAPHIRIFAGNLPKGVDKQTGIKQAADGIRECLDYAAERGIYLGLENHGGITALVEDHLAICDAVGEHPWFGVNLDTGNYRTNPYEDLAMAAPRAVNVQIKVEVFKPDGATVLADLSKFRDIRVKADYKGWVALEYVAEGDPRKEIPMYIRQLKELFEG